MNDKKDGPANNYWNETIYFWKSYEEWQKKDGSMVWKRSWKMINYISVKIGSPGGIHKATIKSSPMFGLTWLIITPCELNTHEVNIQETIRRNKSREIVGFAFVHMSNSIKIANNNPGGI